MSDDPYYRGRNTDPNISAPNYSSHWDQSAFNRGRDDARAEESRRQNAGAITFSNLPKIELIDLGPYTGPKWIQRVFFFFAVPFIGSKFVNASSELTVMLLLFVLMFAIYFGKPIYKLISFIVYMRKNKLTLKDVYRFYRSRPVSKSVDSNLL